MAGSEATQDPFLAALFDRRTSPKGSRAPARTPPGTSVWWLDFASHLEGIRECPQDRPNLVDI